MNAPTLVLLSLALATTSATTPPPASENDTQAASEAPKQTLRGAQCLDPDQTRSWTQIDNRHLLVDAGRNKYQITFKYSCSNLRFSNTIGLRGDPVTGRVCGQFSDAVISPDQPCLIEEMKLLSKEEYKQAMDDYLQKKREAKAARAEKKSAQ